MIAKTWDQLRVQPVDDNDYVWELFHENSKVTEHDAFLPKEAIVSQMRQMAESLDYPGRPILELPRADSLDMPLGETLISRVSPARMRPTPITLQQVATMLFYAYGVTRSNEGTNFLRPFRIVPSGGGLYPLELYISSKYIVDAPAGLLHFNPMKKHLRLLQEGDLSPQLAECLVQFQSSLAFDTSLFFFVTGLFQRSTFKYGARGYRFVLLEAGHAAQNLNLVATALGFGCLNIGGYFDHAVDKLLGFDGLNQSTIYIVAIGEKAAVYQEPSKPY